MPEAGGAGLGRGQVPSILFASLWVQWCVPSVLSWVGVASRSLSARQHMCGVGMERVVWGRGISSFCLVGLKPGGGGGGGEAHPCSRPCAQVSALRALR